MGQIDSVEVEISVVLGRSTLPMQQLLRMGRGAVIPLDAHESEPVWILANNHPVARGEIQISDDRIAHLGDRDPPTSTTTWPAGADPYLVLIASLLAACHASS